jgi:hypothetical protein
MILINLMVNYDILKIMLSLAIQNLMVHLNNNSSFGIPK